MDTILRLLMLTVFAGLLTGVTGSAWAETALRTRMLADNCAICHGTNSAGSLAIPNINGVMSAEDFLFKMNGFYFGDENATVMGHIAKGLNRDQLNDLAFHFAKVNRSR